MIRELMSKQAIETQLAALGFACADPAFSTSDDAAARMQISVKDPHIHTFGVYEDDAPSAAFAFLISEAERYLELIAAVYASGGACDRMFDWVRERYAGFRADFVFRPENVLLREALRRKGATFYPEQQRMTLAAKKPGIDTFGVEPLSERFREQYIAMHDLDCYWTGERVAAALDRFRVYLAIQNDRVVGYLDTVDGYVEDILVQKEHRNRGWGRKLLACAIAENPDGMSLEVDIENLPACALYTSLGFQPVPGENTVTATWEIS